MKLLKFCLVLVLFTGFSACENHMDINDVVEGTPSRADTVLPHKFAPHQKADSSKTVSLPQVFQRWVSMQKDLIKKEAVSKIKFEAAFF